MSEYAYLTGYRVLADTHSQIMIETHYQTHFVWIPRSLCENGNTLKPGDRRIGVKPFFADQEGLGWTHYSCGF